MSQPIKGQGGRLVFRIGPKNTNLVEGVEILLLKARRFKRVNGAVSVTRSKRLANH